MSRRGENIFKRKDGRWEGRYKTGIKDNGWAKYSSVYARSYSECSQKLQAAKNGCITKKNHVTVGQLFEQWIESKKNTIKKSTYANYITLYARYIKPYFEDVETENLTAFMVNRHISDLLESGGKDKSALSANTVQAVIILLKSVLVYGSDIYGLKNQVRMISLPKVESKTVETFTKHEMEIIRSHIRFGNASDMGILLCLYTGMRIGEICALKWSDIDLNLQLISVNKTMYRIKNPAGNSPKTIVVTDTPKSRSSIREIPIPPFMLDELADMKKNYSCDSYFLTGSERYLEPRAYRERYKSFLRSAGVLYRNFHVLRHTFATECIVCGVDVKTVSELLGHSSVKITLDRYVHSSMENKRRQLEKLYPI